MTAADATNGEQMQQLVERAQTVMAHAWMVRAFVRHSEEVEDFPELMEMCRTVFDTARALETRAGEPGDYFKMLGKKLGKLRAAAEQFRQDAPAASSHTNFQQAVRSLDGCVQELQQLLDRSKSLSHSPTDLSGEPPA